MRRRRVATKRSSATCRRCRPRSARRTMRWSANRTSREALAAQGVRRDAPRAGARARGPALPVRLFELSRGAGLAAPAAAGGHAAHRRRARRAHRARRPRACARRRMVAGERRGRWTRRRRGRTTRGLRILEMLAFHFRGDGDVVAAQKIEKFLPYGTARGAAGRRTFALASAREVAVQRWYQPWSNPSANR